MAIHRKVELCTALALDAKLVEQIDHRHSGFSRPRFQTLLRSADVQSIRGQSVRFQKCRHVAVVRLDLERDQYDRHLASSVLHDRGEVSEKSLRQAESELDCR